MIEWIYLIACTVFLEASIDNQYGQEMVAKTIMARATDEWEKNHRFGQPCYYIGAVVFKPKQFSCYNDGPNRVDTWDAVKMYGKIEHLCTRWADSHLFGDDPAKDWPRYYYRKDITPYWVNSVGPVVGRSKYHVFHNKK